MNNELFEGDSDLISACINRDMHAWRAFVEKYSKLVYISISRRVNKYGLSLTHQEIEDVRQDVFASIWEGGKLAQVKNRKNIAYWMSIVSGNAAIECIRKKRRKEPLRLISIFDRIDEEELTEIIPSSGPCPYKSTKTREIIASIESAIEELGEKEKTIMKLNILYGKKHDEIADMLNIPGGTVSSCIKRSKDRLKIKLRDFMK